MPRRATKKDRKKKRYLQEIRESRRSEVYPELEGPMMDWIRRYHPLICDYLLEHLESFEELRCWRVAYTALHELLGGVWMQDETDTEAASEADALWSTFDPFHYVDVHQPRTFEVFTMLPVGFRPAAFAEHYAGFLRFLGDRGILDRDLSRALAVMMRHALRHDVRVGAA